jgi:hypothetical protein
MELDEEIARLFDGADEDLAYDEWRQRQLDDEREQLLEQALDEAAAKGVCHENLKILARETGAIHWALNESIKRTA